MDLESRDPFLPHPAMPAYVDSLTKVVDLCRIQTCSHHCSERSVLLFSIFVAYACLSNRFDACVSFC